MIEILMRRKLLPLAAVVGATAAVFGAGPAAGDPAGNDPNLTGRLLVTVKSPAAMRAVPQRHDLDVEAQIKAGDLLAVDPAPGETRSDLRRELLADPGVERVDTEYYRELRAYVPNDPAYSAADSLNAPYPPNGDRYQWNLRKSNFEAGWEISGGSGATVAIVDTGVSATSPDLTQVAAAAQHDPTPTGPTNDENGHGTHVAGLACANSDNGYGIASAGFDCPIIIEKLDVSGNSLTDASIIAGIYHAANAGAAVINLSLGGPGSSTPMRDAIDYAWAKGSIMIASAENRFQSGDQGYPAKYVQPLGTSPDIHYSGVRGLVVTMAQYEGANAGAGYGTGVSVAAYGDSSGAPASGHPNGLPGIFSAYPANPTTREPLLCLSPPCPPRTSFNGDTRFGYLFGTSMAAPQVSGLVALIRSLYPEMPSLDLLRQIKLGASGRGTWGAQLGWGIIDAGAALQLAIFEADATPPASRVKTKRKSRSRRIKVKIERSDSGPDGKPAAGIENVSVYASRDGRGFRLLRTTSKARFKFKGRRGAKYRFYSRALDRAGNREPAPKRADSSTRILRRR